MVEAYPDIEQTEMFTALQRCMRDRTATHIENEFVYPNGDTTWFELSIQPVPEGLFIMSMDIDERKKGEEALHQAQERLQRDIAMLRHGDVLS